MAQAFQQEKCTKGDYRRLFAASAEPLGWLCYTLTGDEELSDKIFKAALEQSLRGSSQVFRDWMLSWARRLIIRVCIETVRPWNSSLVNGPYSMPSTKPAAAIDRSHLDRVLNLPSELLQQGLLRLDSLSRFVFVLRALEGYSRRETSLLLNIDDRSCEWIYVRTTSALHADAHPLETACEAGLVSAAECFPAHAGD